MRTDILHKVYSGAKKTPSECWGSAYKYYFIIPPLSLIDRKEARVLLIFLQFFFVRLGEGGEALDYLLFLY